MKKSRMFFWGMVLVLAIGMIGCSSGGSSSGGSDSTPPANTSPLTGKWNCVEIPGYSLTFNANGSGSISDGHDISNWTLSASNVLNMNINGTPETFQLTWNNAAKTTMSLQNIGPNSSETLSYTKA